MCIEMGKSLKVFKKSCPLLEIVWVKTKSLRFYKKRGFGVVFIKLTCMCLQTGPPNLKKKTIEFLLIVDFLRIFKKYCFFRFFMNFEIHQ